MSVIASTKPPKYIPANHPLFMIRRSYRPLLARTELRCFSSDPANGLTSSSTLLPVPFSYDSTVRRKLSNQGDWLMTMVIGATPAAAYRKLPAQAATAPAPAPPRTRLRVRPRLMMGPLMSTPMLRPPPDLLSALLERANHVRAIHTNNFF